MASGTKSETVNDRGIWKPGCFEKYKGIFYGGATKQFYAQSDFRGGTYTPQQAGKLMREARGVISDRDLDLLELLREFAHELRDDGNSAHSYVKTKLEHTSNVLVLNHGYFQLNPDERRKKALACDALITQLPGVAMVIGAADCTPVAIFDPEHHAGAIVHSGRTGTAKRISARTLQLMEDMFNTDPTKVVVSIGPSVSHTAYKVLTQTHQEFVLENDWTENDFRSLVVDHGENSFGIDLPAAIRFQLERIGVLPENIYRSGLTTTENSDLFCSASAASGATSQERVANSGTNVYMMILEDPHTDL
jgi:YfiH family protein